MNNACKPSSILKITYPSKHFIELVRFNGNFIPKYYSKKLRPMYSLIKLFINCITISLRKWIKIKMFAKVTSIYPIMKAFVHVRRCVIAT